MRKVVDSWTSYSNSFIDALFPRRCALCGLFSQVSPCDSCFDEFEFSDPRFTWSTGDPLLDYRATLYRYQGRAAQAVRRLKYDRATSLVERMAAAVRNGCDEFGLEPDIVAPVPIHWSRRCSRGFNQAELLCDQLPCRSDALRRIRRTRPQVGLSREERVRNLAGAFVAHPCVQSKSVLLVDDVLTSGQTARECATALRDRGAKEVGILAFCGDA